MISTEFKPVNVDLYYGGGQGQSAMIDETSEEQYYDPSYLFEDENYEDAYIYDDPLFEVWQYIDEEPLSVSASNFIKDTLESTITGFKDLMSGKLLSIRNNERKPDLALAYN